MIILGIIIYTAVIFVLGVAIGYEVLRWKH